MPNFISLNTWRQNFNFRRQECPCLMTVSSPFYKGNGVVRYNIPLNTENTIKSYWLHPSLILTAKERAKSTTQYAILHARNTRACYAAQELHARMLNAQQTHCGSPNQRLIIALSYHICGGSNFGVIYILNWKANRGKIHTTVLQM